MAEIKVKKTPNKKPKDVGKGGSVAKAHNAGKVKGPQSESSKTTLNKYGVK